jgi:hypothetical protein
MRQQKNKNILWSLAATDNGFKHSNQQKTLWLNLVGVMGKMINWGRAWGEHMLLFWGRLSWEG